ncbi:MAG: hypothetical protein MI749_16400, partial [Desulfovibrionales bacterium]|nr:hypothetical protein [Desulfovibrionales bacterium]
MFLSIIGGIIAYAALRNSDPELARRALLLGIVLFAALAASLVALAAFQDGIDAGGGVRNDAITATEGGDAAPEPARPAVAPSLAEIKEQSISVPYEMLAKYSDAYAGDIIQYKGHVIGVLDGQDGSPESYVLKVEVYDTDDRPFAQDRLIWSKY